MRLENMILGQLKQALADPFWIFIFSLNLAKNDLIQYSIQNQIQNIHSKKHSLNGVYIFNGIIPSKKMKSIIQNSNLIGEPGAQMTL